MWTPPIYLNIVRVGRGEFLCGEGMFGVCEDMGEKCVSRRAEGMSEGSTLIKVSIRDITLEELGRIERKK